MSAFRQPGPVCDAMPPASLEDGTLTLSHSPIPGPVGTPRWLGSLGDPASLGSLGEPAADLASEPWWCPVVLQPDVRYLFNSCRNPELGLAEADYVAAAEALGAEVAAIKAVAEVETKGSAFDDQGRPRILYERHYFHRFTKGRFAKDHPTISQKSSGGYGKFSVQYDKLEEAFKLDPAAALKSASWGRFQIMGANHVASGFDTVQAFVDAMARSEAAHLRAFVAFVGADSKLKTALQKKDWTTFAKIYNGPGYAQNQYDTKMAAAYAQLAPPPVVPARRARAAPGGLP